jgi:hypothetical protein
VIDKYLEESLRDAMALYSNRSNDKNFLFPILLAFPNFLFFGEGEGGDRYPGHFILGEQRPEAFHRQGLIRRRRIFHI